MPNTQKENIMKFLNVSSEEADKILLADKAIDRGERMDFDLDPEKEKLAKKMANVNTHKKPTVYNFDTSKKKKKENPLKNSIITELHTFLQGENSVNYENVVITNKGRQITFSVGDENFELTLVQKRKK